MQNHISGSSRPEQNKEVIRSQMGSSWRIFVFAFHSRRFQSLPDVGDQPFGVFHDNFLTSLGVGDAGDGAGRLALELRVSAQQRPLLLVQLLGRLDLEVNVVVAVTVAANLLETFAGNPLEQRYTW